MTKIHSKHIYSVNELEVMGMEDFKKVVNQVPRMVGQRLVAIRFYQTEKHCESFTLEELLKYTEQVYDAEWIRRKVLRRVKKGKGFFEQASDGKYRPTQKALELQIKAVDPTTVKLDFIGTSEVLKQVEHQNGASSSKELVDRGLTANANILLLSSTLHIMSNCYGLIVKIKVPVVRNMMKTQLDSIRKGELSDSQVQKLRELEFVISKHAGALNDEVLKADTYPAPREIMDNIFKLTDEMYNCLTALEVADIDSLRTTIQLAKQVLTSKEVSSYVEGFGDMDAYVLSASEIKFLGSNFAGYNLDNPSDVSIINKMHQLLLSKQKEVMSAELVSLSKRIVVDKQLSDNKKIRAFVKGWNKVKAEFIIDRTTGKHDAGVIFSSEGKRGFSAQIQVGDVNHHSIVIKDDGSIVQLQYTETGALDRAQLVRDLLLQIELNATIVQSTVKAFGKSKLKVYYNLAKIIPNVVDLDLGHGYHGEYRKVAIRAVIKGFAISPNEMREASQKLMARGVASKKMYRVIRKSSSLLGTDGYHEYLSKSKAKTGAKVVYSPYQKPHSESSSETTKVSIPYKPGDKVYILKGKYGAYGEEAIVVKVQDGIVFVKGKSGEVWDKYPENVSATKPKE